MIPNKEIFVDRIAIVIVSHVIAHFHSTCSDKELGKMTAFNCQKANVNHNAHMQLVHFQKTECSDCSLYNILYYIYVGSLILENLSPIN